jgi:hypothetical protein
MYEIAEGSSTLGMTDHGRCPDQDETPENLGRMGTSVDQEMGARFYG